MTRGRALLVAFLALPLAAACNKAKEPPVTLRSALADSADQVMFGVRQFLTEQGVRQAQLRSDTAFMFENGTRIELRGVHLTFFGTTGAKTAVLTSREGSYTTREQRMEARRSVVVVSEDGRRLETEQLRFDQARNEISSDSAYVATEGGRRQSGIGFRSDPNMRFMQCLRACSGTVGEVALPASQEAGAAAGPPRPRTAGDTLRADGTRAGTPPSPPRPR